MAQVGVVEIYTQSNGWVEVPLFEETDVTNPVWEIETASGAGYIHLVDPADADLDFLEFYSQSSGWLAAKSSVGPDTGVTITASINTDSVTMVWYEDTTGDGVPDNTHEIQLQDGTNTYDLSSLALEAGNDVWFEVLDKNRTLTEEVSLDDITLEY